MCESFSPVEQFGSATSCLGHTYDSYSMRMNDLCLQMLYPVMLIQKVSSCAPSFTGLFMCGDHCTVCHTHLVSGHSKGLLHTYVRPVQPAYTESPMQFTVPQGFIWPLRDVYLRSNLSRKAGKVRKHKPCIAEIRVVYLYSE